MIVTHVMREIIVDKVPNKLELEPGEYLGGIVYSHVYHTYTLYIAKHEKVTFEPEPEKPTYPIRVGMPDGQVKHGQYRWLEYGEPEATGMTLEVTKWDEKAVPLSDDMLDYACPQCGNYKLIRLYYRNGEGKHMHTYYKCMYWQSNGPRCGWEDWSVK